MNSVCLFGFRFETTSRETEKGRGKSRGKMPKAAATSTLYNIIRIRTEIVVDPQVFFYAAGVFTSCMVGTLAYLARVSSLMYDYLSKLIPTTVLCIHNKFTYLAISYLSYK